MIRFVLNNKTVKTTQPPGTVLLDFIREDQSLKGTKEGCREGECGACTALVGEFHKGKVTYKACASCLLPLGEIQNKHVVTIEGLNSENLTVVQQAIFDNSASQCGFCTPGIILSLTGFLLSSTDLSYEAAVNALDGNLCRCTGYVSISKAAKALSDIFSDKEFIRGGSRIEQLVNSSVLPKYFLKIPDKLLHLKDSPTHASTKNTLVVAGATDLLVQKPDELIKHNLDFISKHPKLSKIELENEAISVGGGVTVEDFRTSKIINRFFPKMKDDLLLVSSTIIRNKATLAGNLVNASPIADMAIILLALDARLVLKKDKKTRTLLVKEFYKAYKDVELKKNEIIEKIYIPLPGSDFIFSFEKVSNRKYLDIASCNSAMYMELKDNKIKTIRLSAGGVAPIPLFLKKTSDYLTGKEISDKTLKKAKQILSEEISPIDDIRGTAEYKQLLAQQLMLAPFGVE